MAFDIIAGRSSWLLIFSVALLLLPAPAAAFGAGNIPSIAQIEGHNWRHGDIEDILQTLAFLQGKKWTTMLIKRTYFGNWLRDYSQAIDVGSVKGINAATIRILVWILSFMSFGYATGEFEVTEERLGVYRPEEHIDNPLGYADNLDAREYDPRLRGPVRPIETEIDPRTGMKNYIANEQGDWATSAGYLRFSFSRAIHYGRLYTSGGKSGREEDLCEALRCLGQALHCMEDWSAHTNYCELALIEMGHHQVFSHCGSATQMNLGGKRVYPLVTGTFGAVDFLHSVIGEATDHFTQSEVDEVDIALKNAEGGSRPGSSSRGFGLSSGGSDFGSLLANLPIVGDGFASQARDLKAASKAQEEENARYISSERSRDNANVVPGMDPNFDPVKVAGKIYPILEFHDKVAKAIHSGITKIPGLEKILDRISESLSAFVMGLLAPFIRPIIQQVSKTLKEGSSNIISASAKSQFEPWTNPHCTDPTHSMLAKDHFTNILNSCAGRVAQAIVGYVVPRIIFAWENPNVPVNEVVNDVLRAFHHPALRDENVEIHRIMFSTVRQWFDESPRRSKIPSILSAESVKAGDNHILHGQKSRSRGGHSCYGDGGHGKVSGGLWGKVMTRGGDGFRPDDPLPSIETAPSRPTYGYSGGGASSQGYGSHSAPSPKPASHYPAQQTYHNAPSPGYPQHGGHGYQQPSPTYPGHQPPAPYPGHHQPPPQGYHNPSSPGYHTPPGAQAPPGYGGPGYGQQPQYPPQHPQYPPQQRPYVPHNPSPQPPYQGYPPYR